MLLTLLPSSLRKYLEMSKEERQYELRLTLWHTPLLYIIGSFFLVAATIYLDIGFGLANYTSSFLEANFETTRDYLLVR